MLGVSEEILLDFRRAQDRVSGKKSRAASLEETLQEVLRFYLERKDPEERAKRVIARKGMVPRNPPKPNSSTRSLRFTGTVREPIPATVLHQVRFRDRGSCQYKMPSGESCGARRWLQIHHRVPVSAGGKNTLTNLVSLCQAHHQAHHQLHG